MTANMKMIMQRTKVRLPRAPMVLPMMEINRFRVGHDLASLNTRNYNGKSKKEALNSVYKKLRHTGEFFSIAKNRF